MACSRENFTDLNLEELSKCWIEGQYVSLHNVQPPYGKPSWFDEEKFKSGKQFVKKYYGSIFFAHLVSLTMLLYSPQVLKPMIFTGKSETPEKSYRRYVSTAIHVLSWYHGDIWDPNDKARKNLEKVKTYHEAVAKATNSAKTRNKVDTLDVSACGPPLHGGCPLRQSIQKDLNDAIPDSHYGPFFHPSYHSFHYSSNSKIPYFNQVYNCF